MHCLLFDFFGTLVGYNPHYYYEAPYPDTYRLLRERGYALTQAEFVAGFAEAFRTLDEEARATQDEFDMDAAGRRFAERTLGTAVEPGFLRELVEAYVTEWNQGTEFFPGIADFIRALAGRHRLGIISNTHHPQLVHRNLAAMGIAPYFEVVTLSVVHGKRKPHPAIFADTLRQLRCAPEEALFVGDNYTDDYLGARAGGLQAVLIDPERKYLHEGVERVEGLFELQERLREKTEV